MTGIRNLMTGAAGAAGAGGYEVGNSAVFEDGNSEHLTKTFSGAPTNQKQFTISGWYKRGNLGAIEALFGAVGASATAGRIQVYFDAANQLVFEAYHGSGWFTVKTTQVFRDPHAWYNIMCVYDVDNSTSSDRIRIYLNGSRITAFDTTGYPSSSLNHLMFSNSQPTMIGNSGDNSYYDGYQAEVVGLDGVALTDMSTVGETDDNGVWRPINPTAGNTFSNNSFYLNFASSGSDLGNDASGNSNNFTNNNSVSQSDDSPTKNFCVLTPLIVGNGTATFSEGNLKVVQSGGGNLNTFGSIGLSSGKWHYEVTLTDTVDQFGLGIIPVGNVTGNTNQFFNNGIGAMVSGGGDGNVYNNGSSVATITGGSGTDGQTLSCEIDLDNDQLEWFNNAGSSLGTYSFTPTTDNGGRYFPCVHCNDDATYVANFGASSFSKTPSTGFTGISAALLLDQITPTIEDGTAYFQATTYSGNGSSNEINQSGNSTFQPDLVWLKERDGGNHGALLDAVRGATKGVYSSLSNAEYTESNLSFDADGFSLTTTGAAAQVNGSSNTYIGWQWKGDGTSGSTNSSGSINSTINVNTTAGFVAGTFTTPSESAAVRTIGHGLGGALDMLFVKNRASGHWAVWHKSIGNNYLRLNSPDAATSGGSEPNSIWNATLPSASTTTFSIGTNSDVNGNAASFVFYGFRAIPGYSAFGSYEGNGSSNGPLISLDFKPAFTLIKNMDVSADSWIIQDNAREPYNYVGKYLQPNLNAAEGDSSAMALDYLSNGFKVRGTEHNINESGQTHVYMALAENPFAGTTPATAR